MPVGSSIFIAARTIKPALGRRVTTLADGPRARGEHRSELDVSPLAPGPYLIVLTAGTDRVARPLVVAR